MIGGRGLTWYQWCIVGIMSVLIYPDRVLTWIEKRTGRELGWSAIIILEVVGIAALWLFMIVVAQYHPSLNWWFPLIALALLFAVRALTSLANDIFGA